ncbi:transcription factor bHLH47-like [Asparagus officinalis]|uniref:transcription factor bHLH47-like n=1 Tax=Asparagus officinalis TaxID=4686 RepID=UPI00098E132D|nr:transcription factor bHLH47-like [Asparagus officinalis]XP_020241663.1 transcription factor bHLH47-like [Asparagus officinalis]
MMSTECSKDVIPEHPVTGSPSNKKKQGKVPKKIHKAEREKLKRDQLNDLFLELGHVLEPRLENNGKASVLGAASRILRDLIVQVESLRKENVALMTESSYVTVEKNELKDENITLATEIARLNVELQERQQSDPIPQPPVTPIYVLPPFHQDLKNMSEAETAPTTVRKPLARYPTPSDSWPSQILSEASEKQQH